ncbi:MAG: family 10 glycosylhydrolase [Verrucomicrobiae bacterium]|nr:family 10 glycosylhydrolase [Verrucomicrobiae bacterium]
MKPALLARLLCSSIVFLIILGISHSHAADYRPAGIQPPEPLREFRGAWVASVHNIDWPSRAGLSPSQQRAELVSLLDLAAKTGLNAIILQVRPEGDALYDSKIEPWSYWLTGQMGKAPSDGYDPLAFAVSEAHRRGIELHAWFNPFRARATKSVSASSNHLSRTHPEWLLPAGSQTWADPGLRPVQDRAIQVMVDVTKRYDVDAIHIDDYFYPYPKKIGGKMVQQFDDSRTYAAYRAAGGKLEITDWRRAEMNGFIQRLYAAIKGTKPWVKFGISPFGIWRPGYPRGIEADLDSYEHIASDARTWLHEGWLDYLSPQLYWRIDDRPHSFSALSKWWNDENSKGRHVWPGTASSRIKSDEDPGRPASEIARQIVVTRETSSTRLGAGHLHWSFAAIKSDRGGLRSQLAPLYRTVAIPPASPWLAPPQGPPAPQPSIQIREGRAVVIFGKPQANARWRLVQARPQPGGEWFTLRLAPGGAPELMLPDAPAEIAVRNVGYAGQLSEAAGFAR